MFDATDYVTLEYLKENHVTEEDIKHIAEITEDCDFIYDLRDQNHVDTAEFFRNKRLGCFAEDDNYQYYYDIDNGSIYKYNQDADPCITTESIAFRDLFPEEEVEVETYGSVEENMTQEQLKNAYHKTESIVSYTGYKNDALLVRNTINSTSITDMQRKLGLNKPKNAKVIVHPDDFTPADNMSPSTEIHVVNSDVFDDLYDGSYENYLKCNMIAFLYFNNYPNANQGLVYDIAKWESGLYTDYELAGLARSTYGPKSTIDMLYEKGGYEYFRKLVKDTTGTKAVRAIGKELLSSSIGTAKKIFEAGNTMQNDKVKDDHDWSTDGLGKLARRIKMNNKKGVYKLKQITTDVSKTLDMGEYNPDIKLDTDDDLDLSKDEIKEKRMPTHTADLLAAAKKTPQIAPAVGNQSAPSKSANDLDENCLYLSNGESVMMLGEAIDPNRKYNRMLYSALYKDRMRTNKDVLAVYKTVKTDMPFVRYAFLDPKRYKYNLFIDTFFYNQTFFANNIYNKDKAVDLYAELLSRLIDDQRFAGNTVQTVFIPVIDWNDNPDTKMWMYNEEINPISMIIRLMKRDPNRLKSIFGERDIVFLGTHNYFKLNFNRIDMTDSIKNKIIYLIKKLIALRNTVEPDPVDEPMGDSPKAITMDIIDRLDKNQNIKITSMAFTGDTEVRTNNNKKVKDKATDPDKVDKGEAIKPLSKKDIEASATAPEPKSDKEKEVPKDQIEIDKGISEEEKKALVDSIITAASNATSTDDAIDSLDNERVAKLIASIADDQVENTGMNKARAARMSNLRTQLQDKKINGTSVKDMINTPSDKVEVKEQLKVSALPVNSINDEWNHLTYVNFDKTYNVNNDIVAILDAMSDWSYPIAVRDINVADNSTSEDYVDLWTVDCEDSFGKRFKLKFDVPKFINENRYMMLRGNQKTIETQFFLMPIIKTDEDAAQVVTNYNKIFVRRFNTATGKSNIYADKIVRAFKKYTGKSIKVSYGNNTKICSKYNLPLDYADLASIYDKIEVGNMIYYFNQDEIREKYTVDNSKGIPYAVLKQGTNPNDWRVIYYNYSGECISQYIYEVLRDRSDSFKTITDAIPRAAKYTYSKASILNSEIPVVVLCGYAEGLTKTLTKASITYELKEKLPEYAKGSDYDYIRFDDGFLIYQNNPDASLLMNGLKECDTRNYSLGDIDSKFMYTDFLDDYTNRLTADGLDNFYDCMIDPITKKVMEYYDLPTDYVSALLYSSSLLVDNAYIKHTDTKARRIRRAELIAGYVYKAITDSYGNYTRMAKHTRLGASMTMKQSAVVDKILLDPTEKDYSTNNMLTDVESVNAISTKGLSGMNSERSYDLDKRTYDNSMLNIIGMSTGFTANVGMTRHATLDMNVEGNRGYVRSIDNDTSQLTDVKSLTATEAVTPMGTTHDDPFRTAMTFIQKSKHGMRTMESDPLLVTCGADEALPYMSSDIFAFKAKQNGKVTELTDDYMIIEYKDGKCDYVNLENTVQKNSDGGFHVPLKLKTDLKVGSTVKSGQIVAYDPLSIGNNLGEADNMAYKVGTLAKVAILNTEEGFEDSAIMSHRLSEAMSCDIVKVRGVYLPKETNVYGVLSKNTHIEEGDIMMQYQTPYESEDLEVLQRNLAGSEEELSTLGRKPIKAECTGTLMDVRIYRTCEIDELSPSLKKLVNAYEKPIKAKKKALEAHGIDTYTLPPTYKLNPTGKLKNCEDGVFIEFCQQYRDVPAIGDKIVWYSANKGVNKALFPEGLEPYTALRPNEVIDGFITNTSINGRMVCSIGEVGALNKLMVELDRTCKEMLGIPFDDSKA